VITRLTLWRPRTGVTADEALTYWRDTHAQLVQQLPGVTRYVQRVCVAAPDGVTPSYAGVGELSFDDVETATEALASPEWEAVIADASTFMDIENVTAVWVEEPPTF
jgi:uncharacterized protein (TIGR02118 family)